MRHHTALIGFAVLALAVTSKDIRAQETSAPAQSLGSAMLSGARQGGENVINQRISNATSGIDNRVNQYTSNIADREKALNTSVSNARQNATNSVSDYRDGIASRQKALKSSYQSDKKALKARKKALGSALTNW